MKVTFINSENYLEYWDELMNALGYEENVDDFDFYSLFEGDPDKIKIGGLETVFVDFDNGDEKLVCYYEEYPTFDDTNKALHDTLSAFFQEDFKENFEMLDGQGWEAYEAEETSIAYRGGKGYFYTLWKTIAQ